MESSGPPSTSPGPSHTWKSPAARPPLGDSHSSHSLDGEGEPHPITERLTQPYLYLSPGIPLSRPPLFANSDLLRRQIFPPLTQLRSPSPRDAGAGRSQKTSICSTVQEHRRSYEFPKTSPSRPLGGIRCHPRRGRLGDHLPLKSASDNSPGVADNFRWVPTHSRASGRGGVLPSLAEGLV